MMRNVNIGLVVVLMATVMLFTVQNLESLTFSFLTMSLTLPLSGAIVASYVLGMVSGGALMTALRSLVRGVRGKPERGGCACEGDGQGARPGISGRQGIALEDPTALGTRWPSARWTSAIPFSATEGAG